MRLNVRLNKGILSGHARSEKCEIPCFNTGLVANLRKSLPSEDQLEEARVLFAALADQARLKVLHVFRTAEELCVCDVAHVLGMSVSTASHHLRKLRDLKILKYRNDGKMAYYSLREQFAAEIVAQALHQAKGG